MLKHTMVRLAVAAAVYGALSVAYVQQIQGQGQQPSQLSLVKLADDLYVIHGDGRTSAHDGWRAGSRRGQTPG